jgi:hypothetical protein
MPLMSLEAGADLMPRAAVVRLDVIRWVTGMRHNAACFALPAAGCGQRVRVLNRVLGLDSVIAAVKGGKSHLLQSPEDSADARDDI